MSRIGKQPIPIPNGVTVTINKNEVTVKGPKGELFQSFHPDIKFEQQGDEIIVSRPSDLRHHRSLHGLTRSLIHNMVVGVSEGFEKRLVISGVGYRADVQGKTLSLQIGKSHDVTFEATDTLDFEIAPESRGTEIIIRGIDKQEVGQVTAEIRKTRPPEPYKGKGIAYKGEIIRRKAGKSGKTTA